MYSNVARSMRRIAASGRWQRGKWDSVDGNVRVRRTEFIVRHIGSSNFYPPYPHPGGIQHSRVHLRGSLFPTLGWGRHEAMNKSHPRNSETNRRKKHEEGRTVQKKKHDHCHFLLLAKPG